MEYLQTNIVRLRTELLIYKNVVNAWYCKPKRAYVCGRDAT
jgi:hypothetical protein